MKVNIGKILPELIKEQHWTVAKLSKATGVPQSTLREWCLNRSPKNPVQVQKVADILGVSMHYLYFGTQDKQEPIQKILKEDIFQGTFEITVKKVKV